MADKNIGSTDSVLSWSLLLLGASVIHRGKATHHTQNHCPSSPSSHYAGTPHPLSAVSRRKASTLTKLKLHAVPVQATGVGLDTARERPTSTACLGPGSPETKRRTDQITSSSIHLLEGSISASYSSRFPAAMLRPHLPSPMRVYPARHSYHHAEQMLPLSHTSASTCAGQIVTLRNKRKLGVIAPRAGSTSPRLACLIKAAT